MKLWIISLLAVILAGCAGLTRKVDRENLKKVKTIAVAGFSVVHQAPRSDVAPDRDSDIATEYYHDFVTALANEMGWSARSLSTVQANPGYQDIYQKKMKGLQFGKAPVAGKLLRAHGIMDSQSLFRMKPADRDALAKTLGVDAVIEAQVYIGAETKSVAVMGIGTRFPKARLNFRLYQRGQEAPTWFEGAVDGEIAKESVGKTEFFDENDLLRVGKKSAASAFSKLRELSQTN